jgi:hypothetical protein
MKGSMPPMREWKEGAARRISKIVRHAAHARVDANPMRQTRQKRHLKRKARIDALAGLCEACRLNEANKPRTDALAGLLRGLKGYSTNE